MLILGSIEKNRFFADFCCSRIERSCVIKSIRRRAENRLFAQTFQWRNRRCLFIDRLVCPRHMRHLRERQGSQEGENREQTSARERYVQSRRIEFLVAVTHLFILTNTWGERRLGMTSTTMDSA